MILKNWCVVAGKYSSPYTPPELVSKCLSGDIENDKRGNFIQGSTVTTSAIVGKRGDKVVTNSGSEYELGDPAPAYEDAFPNCKQKLFKCLKELP